jgi:hypothetical protein
MLDKLQAQVEAADWRVFEAITGLAGRWRALDTAMIALADHG